MHTGAHVVYMYVVYIDDMYTHICIHVINCYPNEWHKCLFIERKTERNTERLTEKHREWKKQKGRETEQRT